MSAPIAPLFGAVAGASAGAALPDEASLWLLGAVVFALVIMWERSHR